MIPLLRRRGDKNRHMHRRQTTTEALRESRHLHLVNELLASKFIRQQIILF